MVPDLLLAVPGFAKYDDGATEPLVVSASSDVLESAVDDEGVFVFDSLVVSTLGVVSES